MGACFFETLRCMEVDHYLKAFGRYLLSTVVVLPVPTFSNFNTESSVTFKVIVLLVSLSDTPDELNVYLIPQTKPLLPVAASCKISALPYFPASLSSAVAVPVVPVVGAAAKHLPFWRLVLMLVFSPSAKVKASDTCARAI